MLITARMSLRALLVASSTSFALVAAPACAETLDELYAKAETRKVARDLCRRPGHELRAAGARIRDASIRGLTVSIEGGFSNVLNQKIEQQFKDRKLVVDMVLFQTAQDFVRWKGEGRMLAFKPPSFDAIDKSFQDPDGAFIVWYVGTLSYAYNTREVKPENAPKSALDFLKPEFRGKMIACYPHDDDATLYLFHTIMQKYGNDYLEKYVANQPNWVQGHLERLALGRSRHRPRHRSTRPPRPSSISRRPGSRSNSRSRTSIRCRSTTRPPASSRMRRIPTSRSSI